ncbi:MAG: hypothetical protein V4440_08720 [Pseudomonadota bacterium]
MTINILIMVIQLAFPLPRFCVELLQFTLKLSEFVSAHISQSTLQDFRATFGHGIGCPIYLLSVFNGFAHIIKTFIKI